MVSPADTDDDVSTAINQYLSTCDRSRRGSTEPWTEQEDRQLLHAFWLSLVDRQSSARAEARMPSSFIRGVR